MKKKLKMILAIGLCSLGILSMATIASFNVYDVNKNQTLAKTVDESESDTEWETEVGEALTPESE